MKTNHILNIGYPRSGTTWLWEAFTKQAWYTQVGPKENNDVILGKKSVSRYCEDYQQQDITGNFSPMMVAADKYTIALLAQMPSIHASIILRNPYEIFWSWHQYYNLRYNNYTYRDYFKTRERAPWMLKFDVIIERWQDLFSSDRFQVFFHEDLERSPNDFFLDYCSRMSLPLPCSVTTKRINATRYNPHVDASIDTSLTKLIDHHIDRLQPLVHRDLSHWRYNK